MKFTQRLKYLFSNSSFDEAVSRFLTGADLESEDSGMNVDTELALKFSCVFACNKVLAETFASVPAMLYKKEGEGRKAVTDLPIFDILHNAPNEEMAPFNFNEALMTSLNLGGNSVCQKLFNKAGELVGLYPYPHNMVTIDRDRETKKLIYIVKNGTSQTTFTREQVFHVPNMSLNGINGLSPISYAAASIRLGLSYEQYGVNFYRNSAMPSGAFKTTGSVSEIAFNRLKEELKKNYTGLKRVGTPMILEDGLEFQQFTVNPVDAQLLESKYFQIEDICRIYRVPQHLVQLLNKATFSNIEQQSLEFVMYTMLPIFKRFEECINAQLLTPKQRMDGYFIEHKIDGLLRGDSAARAALYGSGRQWGWLSANDCRRLENLPPISGGDIYLTPSNMIDSESLGSDSATETQTNEKVLNEIKSMLEGRVKS
ncbi:MAG: phage portal protein [Clostridia bacterium]